MSLLVALLVIGGVVFLLVHTKDSEVTDPTERVTAGQSSKGEPITSGSASSSNSSDSQNNTSEPGDDKSQVATGDNLITPSGTFVSAHKGVPSDAALSSVCNTTAGATCQITFTFGSTTKSLSSQVTDRGGATYWNSWTPDSIGLTPGTWKVQAVAKLGSQTVTADDALSLEVK